MSYCNKECNTYHRQIGDYVKYYVCKEVILSEISDELNKCELKMERAKNSLNPKGDKSTKNNPTAMVELQIAVDEPDIDDITFPDPDPIISGRTSNFAPNAEILIHRGNTDEGEPEGTLDGLTEGNPGLEFDLLETQDNRISFWRLFYDEHFDSERIEYEFLSQFVATWSQGDLAAIKDMYAKDAEYEDTLFGIQVEGQKMIEKQIEQFLTRGANNWEIKIPFGEEVSKFPYKEEIPFPSTGGVFTITVLDQDGSPCDLSVFIILTPDAEGLIVKQEIFYAVDSLISCGWAE